MPVSHWVMGDTLGSINHKKISSGGDLLSVLWSTEKKGEKDDAELPGWQVGNKTSYKGLLLLSSLISYPLARIHEALLPLGSHMMSPDVYFILLYTRMPLSCSCRQKGPCFQSLPSDYLLCFSVKPPKSTLLQNSLQIYQNAEKNQLIFLGFTSRQYLTMHNGVGNQKFQWQIWVRIMIINVFVIIRKMLATALFSLWGLFHLIFLILWIQWFNYPHFTDKKTETWVIWLISLIRKQQSQSDHKQSLRSFCKNVPE